MEILLAAAVLPVIALCYYIYKKDVNREPGNILRKLFIFGFLSAIPIIIVELFLDNFFATEGLKSFLLIFVNTFISVALVEEGFKWIITKIFGYDNKEFDEVYDIIVYAVFASLGFACIENILYVFTNGLGNAIMRALTSIPGHTCFAVIMGYYFSKAKINHISGNKSLYTRNLIFSILVPCLFHAMYDAIIFYAVAVESSLFVLLFFVFDIVMIILCFNIVKKTSKVQQRLIQNVNEGNITSTANGQIEYHPTEQQTIHFCPLCGRNVDGYNFCPVCGFKVR